MAIMAAVNASLLVLSEKGILPLGWSWLVIVGTLGTFALSWVLGPLLDSSVPKGPGEFPRNDLYSGS